MKVILLGASGMIGQGVMRECLLAEDVTEILSIVRTASPDVPAKVRELVHKDFLDFSTIEGELDGYDACFFCLGVSSAGMKEADYTRITHGYTLAFANALVKRSPKATFIYISGASTDATEQGRTMWARVKGKTENDLFKVGFAHAYMFRPGYIQPLNGIKSRTLGYRIVYAVGWPFYPLLKALGAATNTRNVGLAMLKVARDPSIEPRVFENREINAAATPPPGAADPSRVASAAPLVARRPAEVRRAHACTLVSNPFAPRRLHRSPRGRVRQR